MSTPEVGRSTEAGGRCNNTSVGVLVERDRCLLLIERRRVPRGWAPPAGHVEDGERWRRAAERELCEEVGLRSLGTRGPVLAGRYDNRCRRRGGSWHRWELYEATTTGEPTRSLEETRAMSWVTRGELHDLAELTRSYLRGSIAESDWRRCPGLEPVWLGMLTELGWIGRES